MDESEKVVWFVLRLFGLIIMGIASVCAMASLACHVIGRAYASMEKAKREEEQFFT